MEKACHIPVHDQQNLLSHLSIVYLIMRKMKLKPCNSFTSVNGNGFNRNDHHLIFSSMGDDHHLVFSWNSFQRIRHTKHKSTLHLLKSKIETGGGFRNGVTTCICEFKII
jgi:hypothetical protein